MGFVDQLIDSLKQSVNLNLWLYFFLVQLIEGVVYLIVFAVFAIFGIIAIFGSLGGLSEQSLMQMVSTPSMVATALAAVGIIAFAAILILLYITSLFEGIRFNLFNNFLKDKSLDLGKAFGQAKPRTLTFFLTGILISLIIGALLVIALIPAALSIVPLIISAQTGSEAANAGAVVFTILYLLVIMLVFGLVMLLISPIINLVAPAVFFEQRGAISSIKRAYHLARTSYLGNLAFVILFGIVMWAAGFILNIIVRLISLPLILPMAAGLENVADPAIALTNIMGMTMAIMGFSMIIIIPYSIWVSIFQVAAFRNLYFYDLSLINKGNSKNK